MITACSDGALEAGEDLLGTAPECTDFWLLIESRDAFPAAVVKESPLADLLRPLTERLATEVPTSRVQFIRRTKRKGSDGGFKVFVANSQAGSRGIYEGSVSSHSELLDMDVADLKREGGVAGLADRSRPLVLLCTHGKRDRCCALHGRAFLDALGSDDVEDVWETSHLGGHRFAATCLTLPFGHYYGRLRPSEASAFMASIREAQMHDLGSYRGDSRFSRRGQFAEGTLRRMLDDRDPNTLDYRGESHESPDQVIYSFFHRPTSKTYQLRIQESEAPLSRSKSCGKDEESFTTCTSTLAR